jgi:hypothetical protein
MATGVFGGSLREELPHAGHLILESMLGEFAVLREDRDLRRSFV